MLSKIMATDIHIIPISTRQFVYEVGQLRLRGDVIIRCYQIIPNDRAYHSHHHQPHYHHQYASLHEKRELVFSSQFHTCAVTDKVVSFTRNELDYACDGKKELYVFVIYRHSI